VEGIRLTCYYRNSIKKCEIYKIDLSNIFREEKFEISGSADEISETIAIEFRYSPNVHFIPPAIVDTFPNLIELEVTWSKVPIIKNDLFSSKFYKI
jgi:Leucine-rich repeat (LRR) protein